MRVKAHISRPKPEELQQRTEQVRRGALPVVVGLSVAAEARWTGAPGGVDAGAVNSASAACIMHWQCHGKHQEPVSEDSVTDAVGWAVLATEELHQNEGVTCTCPA